VEEEERMRKWILASLLVAPLAWAHGHFHKTELVSNVSGRAAVTDGNLVDARGLAVSPSGHWWVADNGSGLATLYDSAGALQSLVVHVDDSPTGLIFNAEGGFVVSDGTHAAPSLCLFAAEGGQILGWSPHVGRGSPSMEAQVAVDHGREGAVYKGIALARNGHGERILYVTNFHDGQVEMYDSQFRRIHDRRAFDDDALPPRYAPFGIAALGDHIFVTYALQDDKAHDDVKGPGHGFVDEYDTDGGFVRRVASREGLDSPWGLARAPQGFGSFGGDLLVGQFGDGSVQVYHPGEDGHFHYAGALLDRTGKTLVIDGLWSIAFGNGAAAGPHDALFFTAGPNEEANGRFGKITFLH
jgi:uncharacterized protein (TIGR03118 family)